MKPSEALLALLGGHNEKALALLHNDRSPGATWERMRAHFRLRNFERAIDIADGCNPGDLVYEETVAVGALHVFLLARIGRVDEAFAKLPALSASIEERDRLGMLEYRYICGYLDYCERRYDDSLQHLQRVLKATAVVADDRRRFPFQPDSYLLRAKAATLIGVMYSSRNRIQEMERAHCDALLSAEQSTPRDAFLEAMILANLSCLIGKTYSASAIRILQSRARSFEWNAGLEEHRAYIKRHLRMARYLYNPHIDVDTIGGRSAPSFAFRFAECLDSLLLADWESKTKYREELAFATDFVSRVNWEASDGEEFTSLIEIVPVLSPFEFETANDARGRYIGKLSTLLPHFTTSSAELDRAQVHFAASCLAKAEGDWSAARREAELSLDVFDRSGVVWRTAIAALELFTLTRDRTLLQIPRDFTVAHPGTPFSRRLERALALAPQADRGAFIYLKDSVTP